jgi:hypothetical protein
MYPNSRSDARLARELIQAAGPPDESNETVYRVVEEFAADRGLTAWDLVRL